MRAALLSRPPLPKIMNTSYFFTWFRDDAFNRLFKNAGILLTGNVGASLLGLASLALTARALGPEQLGILVLIQTYIAIVDRLFNFQSWQAIIKYGAEALEHDRRDDFKGLIKFGTILDMASAIVATVVAILAAYWIGQWKGWDTKLIQMVMLYSLVILFNLSGTPTAILRLFDQFKFFSAQKIFTSVFKLSTVAIAYFCDAGLWTFLLIWMASQVLGYFFLFIVAWWAMRKQGYKQVMKIPVGGIGKRHNGLWKFVWTTNLNASLRMVTRELDLLIIGGMAGAAAAGLYKIAKQFSNILAHLSDPLYQSIYPELAKLWTTKMFYEFKQLMMRSSLIAGSLAMFVWLFFVFFGKAVLLLTVGQDFTQSQPVLVLYMLAVVIAVCGFPLQPAMLSMGKPHISFWVHVVSTVFYFILLPICIALYGIVGAAVSYLTYYLIWSSLMISIEMTVISKIQSYSIEHRGL